MNIKLTPAGWVRLVLYALASLAGLAVVISNSIGYTDLAVLLGTIAGAGATITGGTAAFNLPKADDQRRAGGFNLGEIISALGDIAAAARAYQAAVKYQPRHAAAEEQHDDPTAAYAASIRGE